MLRMKPHLSTKLNTRRGYQWILAWKLDLNEDLESLAYVFFLRMKEFRTVKLPPHVNINDKVILFDGVCRLCNGWVRFLIKYDKHGLFRFCSAQSAEGQAILQWLGLPTDTFETMLLIEGETVYTKSDAFPRCQDSCRLIDS
jgi:hypothetical protein